MKIELRRLIQVILITSLAMPLLFSCAGSNQGHKPKLITYNLGKCAEFDVINTIPRLLRKFQFIVMRNYDTGAYRTIETEWKTRFPMEDEAEIGIIAAKMRLFFRMRKTMDQLFYVQLEVQNMVRTPDAGDWFHSPMTKNVEDDIMRMVDELKQEFEEGRLRRR